MKNLAFFLLFLLSTTAYTQPTHKEQVLETVKNYALANACLTTFEKTKDNNFGEPSDENIYISYTTTDHVFQGINNYLVLWGGYDACDIAARGNNYTYSLTKVVYNELANRFIIKDSNVIYDVKDEPFFTLANVKTLEQLDDSTFEVGLYMFNSKDIDSETENLKEDAIPGFYNLTLKENYSDEYSTYEVLKKVRMD